MWFFKLERKVSLLYVPIFLLSVFPSSFQVLQDSFSYQLHPSPAPSTHFFLSWRTSCSQPLRTACWQQILFFFLHLRTLLFLLHSWRMVSLHKEIYIFLFQHLKNNCASYFWLHGVCWEICFQSSWCSPICAISLWRLSKYLCDNPDIWFISLTLSISFVSFK